MYYVPYFHPPNQKSNSDSDRAVWYLVSMRPCHSNQNVIEVKNANKFEICKQNKTDFFSVEESVY